MNRIYAWLGVLNTNKSPQLYNGPEYKQDMYTTSYPTPNRDHGDKSLILQVQIALLTNDYTLNTRAVAIR